MHGSRAHNQLMIRKNTFSNILLLGSCCLALNACSTVGILSSAAAVTGISAAQEGGLSAAYSDAKINVNISEAWFQYNVDAFTKLNLTVNQGRVLITGVVQNPEHRVEAVRLAWQVKGVNQVINEIRVAESEGIKGYVKDKWITSRLRGSLTWDRGVQSINYSLDTVQGVVYLMGVAQNQTELNRVIETARTISGVKRVVSYVKLAGEPIKGKKVDDGGEEGTSFDAEPVQLHKSSTNLNTNSQSHMDGGVDVPAKSIPEDAPTIEDQYNN